MSAKLVTTDIQTDPWRAPSVPDGYEVLYDEPGRVICNPHSKFDVCYRSHHFRVVAKHGLHTLFVRHGGGDEAIPLASDFVCALAMMDSDARFLTLYALMDTAHKAARNAESRTADAFRKAFAQGRLKKRKVRGTDAVRVWIEGERT